LCVVVVVKNGIDDDDNDDDGGSGDNTLVDCGDNKSTPVTPTPTPLPLPLTTPPTLLTSIPSTSELSSI